MASNETVETNEEATVRITDSDAVLCVQLEDDALAVL